MSREERIEQLRTFTRESDQKIFKSTVWPLEHWTPIVSDDGDEDVIKFAWQDAKSELFVGFNSGNSFTRPR